MAGAERVGGGSGGGGDGTDVPSWFFMKGVENSLSLSLSKKLLLTN